MPKISIEIEKSTLEALQGIAIPLVDSCDSVIARLIEKYQKNAAKDMVSGTLRVAGEIKPRQFAPDDPPNLTHTRLIRSRIDSRAVPKANWNQVLRHLYEMAVRENSDFAWLKTLSAARIAPGIKETEGFKPIAGNRVSLQGVAASEAWRFSLEVARKLNKPIFAEFEWRNKKGAQFPGQRGMMSWPDATQEPYLRAICEGLGEWADAQDDKAFANL